MKVRTSTGINVEVERHGDHTHVRSEDGVGGEFCTTLGDDGRYDFHHHPAEREPIHHGRAAHTYVWTGSGMYCTKHKGDCQLAVDGGTEH